MLISSCLDTTVSASQLQKVKLPRMTAVSLISSALFQFLIKKNVQLLRSHVDQLEFELQPDGITYLTDFFFFFLLLFLSP